jgi:hypothetical protein
VIAVIVTFPDGVPCETVELESHAVAFRFARKMVQLFGARIEFETWCDAHEKMEPARICDHCDAPIPDCAEVYGEDGDDFCSEECAEDGTEPACSCSRGCIKCVGVSADGPI